MVFDQQKIAPVLAGIYMVTLPMFSRMPPYIVLLVFCFTGWTLLMIVGRVKAPGSFIRLLLSGTVLLSLLLSYGTIIGQEPGTFMLLMLSFLKLFEMKGKRDVLLVIFIGYFLVATSFFHSQSPWIAVYMFVVVIYLTSLLIIFSDRLSSIDFKTRIIISARMLLHAVPLMLILFVFFPRIPGPLWSLPRDAHSSNIGVDDEMSPGSINDLISSGDVAFRVQFKGEAPENRDLYWRGVVLSLYDGKTWLPGDITLQARADSVRSSNKSSLREYTVMLEPHGRKWLYSLENLIAIEGAYTINSQLQVFAQEPVSNVMAYTMSSDFKAINKVLYEQEIRENRLLPQSLNPKTLALAEELRLKANGKTEAIANSVLAYFNTQPFFYTLSPPLLAEDAMDDFIFNTRRGFCEHYSSAFVYLMRAAGVPARIVVGYQGGTVSPVDDYMIVRQSDAHAWTEIWIENRGWLRVDPTAAVSPDRIELGIANAGLEEAELPSILLSQNENLTKLRYQLDSLNHSWNKWIIGFNETKQKELFKKLGVDNIDRATLFSWMVIAMTLSGGLVALWVFSSGNRRAKHDVAAYYYDVFCRRLEKAGLAKKSSESADAFLLRIVQQLPELRPQADFITRYYQRMRYGDDGDLERQKKFIQAVKNFRVKTAAGK